MTSFIKAAFLGLALTAAGATGAMAGKTTTPNTTAPVALTAGQIAAMNAALVSNGVPIATIVEATTDGSTITLTLDSGQVLTVSSRTIANFLALYG